MLETISLALSHTVEGWNCLAMVCGAAWGIIGGALPGITGAVSVALILPFTFGMSPSMSLALLVLLSYPTSKTAHRAAQGPSLVFLLQNELTPPPLGGGAGFCSALGCSGFP